MLRRRPQEEIEKVRKRQAEREAEKAQREEELVSTAKGGQGDACGLATAAFVDLGFAACALLCCFESRSAGSGGATTVSQPLAPC